MDSIAGHFADPPAAAFAFVPFAAVVVVAGAEASRMMSAVAVVTFETNGENEDQDQIVAMMLHQVLRPHYEMGVVTFDAVGHPLGTLIHHQD